MLIKAKYDCIKDLKEQGDPVILVAVTQEIEAILNACKDNGIKVAALCDNEIRKTNKKFNIFGVKLRIPKKF